MEKFVMPTVHICTLSSQPTKDIWALGRPCTCDVRVAWLSLNNLRHYITLLVNFNLSTARDQMPAWFTAELAHWQLGYWAAERYCNAEGGN